MFNQNKKKLDDILKDKRIVITDENNKKLNDVDRRKMQNKLKGAKT